MEAGAPPLKIGLVIERLDPVLGGVEQWTYQFADWLLRRGDEVHVVARGPRKARCGQAPEPRGPFLETKAERPSPGGVSST